MTLDHVPGAAKASVDVLSFGVAVGTVTLATGMSR